MGKIRYLVSKIILTTVLTTCALAQTNLTQIRDTITNSNGTPFNGTVIITWNGYSTALTGSISPLSTSARIYTGALSVLLVPTTTASTGSYYQVVYSSSDGTVMWTETWQVPSSTTALTVAAVRISTTATSGSGTSTGSTGGGPTTGGGSGSSQYATLPIAINQVTNLSSNLSQINASITSLTNTVSGLSSGTVSSNVVFVDSETPTGTLDGTNTSFQLSQLPMPVGSLEFYRNGLVLQAGGVDYTLSGQSITFVASDPPQPGDILQAYYRVAGTSSKVAVFSDDEVPSGVIDGVNSTFTLSYAPSPGLSLKVYKNGQLMQQNNDYTLSGSSIVFVSAATPQAGDSVVAFYRH